MFLQLLEEIQTLEHSFPDFHWPKFQEVSQVFGCSKLFRRSLSSGWFRFVCRKKNEQSPTSTNLCGRVSPIPQPCMVAGMMDSCPRYRLSFFSEIIPQFLRISFLRMVLYCENDIAWI